MKGIKIRSKILALFLSVAMFITVLPISNEQVMAASNEEITQKLTELSASMNGKYWNAGIDVSNTNDFGTTNVPCPKRNCHSNHWRRLSS